MATKPMTHETDNLYSQPRAKVDDFRFDEQVAHVFPDMIKRSVPGYNHIISTIGILANQYAQPHTHIYDLGCSLGAATLSMRHRIQAPGVTIIAIDNSQDMLNKAVDYLDIEDSPIGVNIRCDDIVATPITNASFAVLNFTLQFIPPKDRLKTLQNLSDGMLPGGALVLSEKLTFTDQTQNELFIKHHHDFKRSNGYSDLEISQKRQAIEQVLLPETADAHIHRLKQAGFSQVSLWFQSFNFASFLAIK